MCVCQCVSPPANQNPDSYFLSSEGLILKSFISYLWKKSLTDMMTNEGPRLQDWIKDPPNYPDSDPIWETEVPLKRPWGSDIPIRGTSSEVRCVGGFRGSSTIIGFNVLVCWTGDEKLEFRVFPDNRDAFNEFEAVQVLVPLHLQSYCNIWMVTICIH